MAVWTWQSSALVGDMATVRHFWLSDFLSTNKRSSSQGSVEMNSCVTSCYKQDLLGYRVRWILRVIGKALPG